MRNALLLFLLCSGLSANAQFARGVFFEVGGSGGLGSINFEKKFHEKNSLFLTWRAGLSFSPIDKNNGTAIVFPLMANVIYGKTAHLAEAGIGQGITVTTKGNFFFRMPVTFCYRYQPPGKHFYLRAGYMPLISYLVDFQWEHWGGVSFGYSFSAKEK